MNIGVKECTFKGKKLLAHEKFEGLVLSLTKSIELGGGIQTQHK